MASPMQLILAKASGKVLIGGEDVGVTKCDLSIELEDQQFVPMSDYTPGTPALAYPVQVYGGKITCSLDIEGVVDGANPYMPNTLEAQAIEAPFGPLSLTGNFKLANLKITKAENLLTWSCTAKADGEFTFGIVS